MIRAAGFALLLTSIAGPLAAQGKETPLWQFGNLQQGYCIHFLVSPADAGSVLPDEAQPVRLDAMADAPPALIRVMQDQPEYGAWMPAAVCVFRFGRADGAGRELVAAAGASEMIGMVGYWARVSAAQPPSSPYVPMMFTNDKRIAKATDSSKVAFRLLKTSFGAAAHGDDERHVISFGKTSLIWDGHAASDSAPLAAPLEKVWALQSPRSPILIRWKLTASTSRSMVGALVVEGKDKLAKILRNSPIRYLGPIYQGGLAELTLVPE